MTTLTRRMFLAIVLALVAAGPLRGADPVWIARGSEGMVASDSPEASQIGAGVLSGGGNAFDAAVATSCALAVARPFSTGLGGGGFMVAYLAESKRCVVLDFRETAPAAATPEKYRDLSDASETGPSPSIYGGNAVGVPGQVAGLREIHARYGTQAWGELLAPAITLANVGFAVDAAYRQACRHTREDFSKWPALQKKYAPLYDTLLGAGQPPKVGERVRRPNLARGLRELAEQGPEAFYTGAIAEAVVAAVRSAGGELTAADLRNYRVAERQPIRAPYHEYEIVTVPPPSSGGVCIVEALNVLDCAAEAYTGRLAGLRKDNRFAPTLVHAFKHAFADRARWLGDPDFTDIPTERLTSREYACRLAGKLTITPEDFGGPRPPEDRGTSHFCVADRFGNVVAITETINGGFGSLVVAEPFGIILNNQMDDFLTVPGQANLYGLQQSKANLVGPGKRPLSSMSPTIVLQNGRPVLALGASGGPRIITSVMQVMLNVLEFDQPLGEAIEAVRVHHQWQPDEVYFDQDPPKELAEALRKAGEKLSNERREGVVQAIRFLPDGTMVGASDPRKGGRPAGVP